MAFQQLESAKILPFTPDQVWVEMRDFILQTKHFGLFEKVRHFNPDSFASDACGCIRAMKSDDAPDLYEECTYHSDEERRFDLTVQSPNHLNLDNYKGKVTVTALTDGTSLCQFSCSFNGAEILKGFIADFYGIFFMNIATKLGDAPTVSLEQVGPLGESKGTRLAGKVAIVTGGGSGIGLACSQKLAEDGAIVVVADMKLDSAEQAAKTLPGAWACEVDVTKVGEVDNMVEQVAAKLGRVDILVNNAGVAGQQVPTHKHPVDNWLKVTNVNLNGAFYCLRACLAQMVKQEPQGGVVVNMSSTAGLQAMAEIPAYTASKAALIGLTRQTAVEYATHGVRVVALCPTICKTPLVEGFMESAPHKAKTMMSFNPMPGMPAPEDIANAAAFMCSDDAKWMSGIEFAIDGAYTAGSANGGGRGTQ